MDLLRAELQGPLSPGLARPLHRLVLPRRADRVRGRASPLLRMPARRRKGICGKMGAGERRRRAARRPGGFGGAERVAPRAPAMDLVLQSERLDGRAKRTHEGAFADLPDGACVTLNGDAYAVRGAHLLRWSHDGYTEKIARPAGAATVLTPPSFVGVLSAGYQPQWHPSAS